MKKTLILLLLSLSIFSDSFSQDCLPNGIIFTSQSQIDSFEILFPTCEHILGKVVLDIKDPAFSEVQMTNMTQVKSFGSLEVIGNEMQFLTGPPELEEIKGNFILSENTQLRFLLGFEMLKTIGLDLVIENNPSIDDFRGLSELSELGGQFIFNQNAAAQRLPPVNKLSQLNNGVVIKDNQLLYNIENLVNVTTFTGDVVIENNDWLQDVRGIGRINQADNIIIKDNGRLRTMNSFHVIERINNDFILENNELGAIHNPNKLTYIGGDLIIKDHPNMIRIDSLTSLSHVRGNIQIQNNPLVDYIALPGLDSIGGDLIIKNHAALTNTRGWSNLKKIGGDLIFEDTKEVRRWRGFEALEEVGGNLILRKHELMIALSALEGLQTVQDTILIEENPRLRDLLALDNMSAGSISKLILLDNDELDVCNTKAVCEYVERNIDDYQSLRFDIQRNAMGCSSFPEIYVSCDPDRCLPYGDNFRTQGDVDAFAATNPGCKDVFGPFNIDGLQQDITDLSPFQSIETIREGFTIRNTLLQNLSGLESLREVKFGMDIMGNPDLEVVTGVENLKKVGALDIRQNSILLDFFGFSGLDTVTNTLNISGHESVLSCTGFDNLQYIGEDLKISDNWEITDLDGFENLDYIGRALLLENSIFQTISGLNALNHVGEITFFNTDQLEDFGSLAQLKRIEGSLNINVGMSFMPINLFTDLEYVGESIFIGDNFETMEINGFDNLREVAGSVDIQEHIFLMGMNAFNNLENIGGDLIMALNVQELPQIESFQNLKTIGNQFRFEGNFTVENLNFLSNLESVGKIYLANNDGLTTLEPFSNIDHTQLNDLFLSENFGLSICNVEPICSYIADDGAATIGQNAMGCMDEDDLNLACLVNTQNIDNQIDVTLFPNPTEGVITLSRSEFGTQSGNNLAKAKITIISLTGKVLLSENLGANHQIHLPKGMTGMLILKVETEEGVAMKRIIKI